MSYLTTYIEGGYEITQYTSGGSVRDKMTREIIAEYTNYWTMDGSTHPQTQEELDEIERRLGVRLEAN
jgi:hypothetical protein